MHHMYFFIIILFSISLSSPLNYLNLYKLDTELDSTVYVSWDTRKITSIYTRTDGVITSGTDTYTLDEENNVLKWELQYFGETQYCKYDYDSTGLLQHVYIYDDSTFPTNPKNEAIYEYQDNRLVKVSYSSPTEYKYLYQGILGAPISSCLAIGFNYNDSGDVTSFNYTDTNGIEYLNPDSLLRGMDYDYKRGVLRVWVKSLHSSSPTYHFKNGRIDFITRPGPSGSESRTYYYYSTGNIKNTLKNKYSNLQQSDFSTAVFSLDGRRIFSPLQCSSLPTVIFNQNRKQTLIINLRK